MKLSPDKQSLRVNECITLHGIPAEAFEYRLGSRSALEWVIDQYHGVPGNALIDFFHASI